MTIVNICGPETLVNVAKALSYKNRLKILALLSQRGEMNISGIVRIYSVNCSPILEKIGIDKMRVSVEGLEKKEFSLDWSRVYNIPVVADVRMALETGELKIVQIRSIESMADL